MPIKQTTLQHHIDEICQLILNNHLNEIILVAHSYGAMVITGALDQLYNHISCLVYIDSAIPQNGKSLYGLLQENGFNYQDFGLTLDSPCIEPLYFYEKKFQEKTKAYIRCLQSEFAPAIQTVYWRMTQQAEKYHWLYFSLDTSHDCMLTQPKELAVILSDMSLLV